MSKKKTTQKGKTHKGRNNKRASLSQRERNALDRMMRLVYCWRYVDHARAEAGEPIPASSHGYNLLTVATPAKVDAAYALASNTPMHWQVLVIGYVQHGDEEYHSWAWLKSKTPIIAAGEGITPLLAQANDIAMDGLEDDAHCFARATIMAPWDEQHPIRPDRLAGRLQTRLGLSKEEVLALGDWGEPETMAIDAENIDLEIAKALREDADT